MSRLPPIDPERLGQAARAIYDEIAADHRGEVRGPWPIELRVPETAKAYHDLYRRLCVNPKVGRRLFELMILVVARHLTAQFEWFAHERQALAHGVSPEIVEAIRDDRAPAFERDDERIVYTVTRELMERHRISPATYAAAFAEFGEEQLVELIVGAGTYTSIGMQLNAFDIQPPPDARLLDERRIPE